ncbi:DUF2007 domain-containing protein [Parabacteroides sp. PF5-6]|uniref:putative signal transducing protein n=1 Tax=Parabacteroides sp. PF5-6 TaxID=1742403 RepID=UPI0024056749|nr:DUF2007 domain-containing protein [Parabacteroides sp. PF5-6]MDF9828877.1 hypothetical protein [Parabacteroides sp. PF5-6]
MEERMVEIARFSKVDQARMLVSLLQSEEIDCYINNEYTTQVFAGLADMGGARVEVLESDVKRAMEVMEANGYEIPGEDELPDQVQTVSNWTRHIPFLRNLPLEKQILFFFILIAVCLTVLVYASKLFE